MNSYKRLDSRIVKKGNVMDFHEVDVELPDGSVAHWDLIHHSGGAAVLPIDDDGKIIYVRQYRLGVDKELIEIPAGKSEQGEKPIDTIKREMEEEIGYISDDIVRLMDFYPAPAYSEEKTVIFLAKSLKKTKANPDADEFVTIDRHSLGESVEMIKNGEIVDGKTIAAIMYYANVNQE